MKTLLLGIALPDAYDDRDPDDIASALVAAINFAEHAGERYPDKAEVSLFPAPQWLEAETLGRFRYWASTPIPAPTPAGPDGGGLSHSCMNPAACATCCTAPATPAPEADERARETFERQMAAVDANERAAFRAASEGHRIGSRWLTQTILHDPDRPEVMGNCWQTCIACIFNLPLDQVPHFVQDHDTMAEVEAATRAWASERGFDMLDVPAYTLDGSDVVAMLHGRSSRGVAHVIVRTANGSTHDPHPSRAGLSSVAGAFVFVPIDPAPRPAPGDPVPPTPPAPSPESGAT